MADMRLHTPTETPEQRFATELRQIANSALTWRDALDRVATAGERFAAAKDAERMAEQHSLRAIAGCGE